MRQERENFTDTTPERGTLFIECTDPLALVTVRDPTGREIAAGLQRVNVRGLPGVYHAVVRVPGRQEEHLVVLPPGQSHEERLVAPRWRSVIPTRDNRSSEYLWSDPQFLRAAHRAGRRRSGAANVVIYSWQSSQADSPAVGSFRLRPYGWRGRWLDGRPLPKPSASGGRGYRVVEYDVPPGTHELVFNVPDLGRRAQAIPAESGWTTFVFARTFPGHDSPDFSGAAIVLQPQGVAFADTEGAFYRETEAALDALFFGHKGITLGREAALREKISEPILAMAAAYARLWRYSAWFEDLTAIGFDFVLAQLVSDTKRRLEALGSQDAQHLEELAETLEREIAVAAEGAPATLAAWIEDLDAVILLGRRLVETLPHSVDARLLTISSTWLKHALQLPQREDGERISDLPEPSMAKRMEILAPIPLVTIIAGLAGAALLLLGGFLSLSPSSGASAPDFVQLGSTLFALGVGVFSALGFTNKDRLRRRKGKPRLLPEEPPVFGMGADILLRLAAQYEQICGAGSPLVGTALRLTTDTLWTRWDVGLSPWRANRRFFRALRDLESTLRAAGATVPETGTRTGDEMPLPTLRESAWRHLAISLRLPLSLIQRTMRRASPQVLRGVLALSRAELGSLIQERLAALSAESTVSPFPSEPFASRRHRPLVQLGLVLALIMTVIFVVILAPVFLNVRENAQMDSCRSNEEQLGIALAQYEQDNDEKLPNLPSQKTLRLQDSWSQKIYPFVKSAKTFRCPQDDGAGPLSYMYNDLGAGHAPGDFPHPESTIILFESSNASLDFVHRQGTPLIFGIGHAAEDQARQAGGTYWEATALQAVSRHDDGAKQGGVAYYLAIDGHVKRYPLGAVLFPNRHDRSIKAARGEKTPGNGVSETMRLKW